MIDAIIEVYGGSIMAGKTAGREIARLVKKDYVGILTQSMVERKYKMTSAEVADSLIDAGFMIVDKANWIEELRDSTAIDRTGKFLDLQKYWLEHNERAFEFVAERAYREYRDSTNQTDVLKIHLVQGEDDNVEIG